MFIIGLVLGLAGGYFLHANQDAVIKFVDEKVGKWFKRSSRAPAGWTDHRWSAVVHRASERQARGLQIQGHRRHGQSGTGSNRQPQRPLPTSANNG